jgi:outer membrane receptor protein involved in Fe transport
MKKILQLSLFVIALFSMSTVMAQTTIKGSVADKNESLVGASVYVEGTTSGTQTNLAGDFTFNTDLKGVHTIVISFVGYIDLEKEVTLNGSTIDLGKLTLESDAIGMEEMTVIASIAKDRETPVAMSTVSAEEIALANNGNELPEALNTTPAVYATKGGGVLVIQELIFVDLTKETLRY